MRNMRPQRLVSELAAAALAGALGILSQAGAAEFRFVTEDLGEKRAAWVPREVEIHRSTEMQNDSKDAWTR